MSVIQTILGALLIYKPSVDSVISDFMSTVTKLETLAGRHSAKAVDFRVEATGLIASATELESEASRATQIANNIRNIIKV